MDGYVRLFKVGEKKNMKIVAQMNIQDKAFKVVALQLNAQEGNDLKHSDRLFGIVT